MSTTKAELHRLVDGLPDDLLDSNADGTVVPAVQAFSVLRDLSRIMAILTRMTKDLARRQAPLGPLDPPKTDIFC